MSKDFATDFYFFCDFPYILLLFSTLEDVKSIFKFYFPFNGKRKREIYFQQRASIGQLIGRRPIKEKKTGGKLSLFFIK
jgi:hypothetical protein